MNGLAPDDSNNSVICDFWIFQYNDYRVHGMVVGSGTDVKPKPAALPPSAFLWAESEAESSCWKLAHSAVC